MGGLTVEVPTTQLRQPRHIGGILFHWCQGLNKLRRGVVSALSFGNRSSQLESWPWGGGGDGCFKNISLLNMKKAAEDVLQNKNLPTDS